MYTEFYGLRGEPFLLTPDHHFYFESSVHSQAMAHLTYGLSRGEGFIVITGDVGAGKTTLVKRLYSTLDRSQVVAAHVVTTLLSGTDLLHMVAAAFGLDDIPINKSALLLQLQRFFETIHGEGRRALLIVDEAQNLTVGALEELRMLSNIQVGSAAPFQSFLVGQPQFRALISSPELEQLQQRVIAFYHLGPLTEQECGEYVQHRLHHVGWTEDPAFEPDAMTALYKHTGGIPRRINTLGNRLMMLGFLDELHRFSADDVERVAGDLANESNFGGSDSDDSAPHSKNGANGTNGAASDLATRLVGVEKRLTEQETFLRRTAIALQQFLEFRGRAAS